MHKLNLPAFPYRLKEASGKVWIFDGIRKKYILLTPEEWVRQHFVNYLIAHKGYPKSLIKIESGLTYNQRAKRTDIVVYNRSVNPWLVVECKAPDIELNEQAVRQVFVYNKTLQASYVVMTNGMKHICLEISDEVKVVPEIPDYA